MAVQSVTTDHSRDNLITGHKDLVTSNKMQLASGVVVRGEMVKENGAGALVPLALVTDTPYAVILQATDASGGAADTVYSRDCSVLASELTFAVGTMADFRLDIAQNTEIHVEE